MACAPKVGILPLYLKLYDEICPERRAEFTPFLEAIVDGFRQRGVSAVLSETCRVRPEFERAVAGLEDAGVDLLVTVHLAYSPSLEAVEALVNTALPILMLDTTMDEAFGKDVDASRIMYNHGIHGVQDLACMLRRAGRPYQVIAGHLRRSDILDRAVEIARGVAAAHGLEGTRVLRLGEPFAGMGDFAVTAEELDDAFGITVEACTLDDLAAAAAAVGEAAVEAEMARDRERFTADIPSDVHRRSVRAGLGLRALLEAGDAAAFSMNFLAFDRPDGPAAVVPFLEASKAMARGLGYAGEGDVLTASLVGALARAFGQTTFTELFCPDWAGNAVFLSHMGEINPDVVEGRAVLLEKPYSFSAAQNPAVVTGAPAAGVGTLVNLAPGPDGSFGLIAARVEILGDSDNPSLRQSVRGWIRPEYELSTFLEDYSLNGGTHHSALLLGDHLEGIAAFAENAGLGLVIL